MLHLFLLLNASVIILDQNVAPINEQEKFPDVRLRIIYDILLESVTKHPHSPYLQDLVYAILQHVETNHQTEEKKLKEKEAEKLKEKEKNKEKVKETAKERRERRKKKKSVELKEEIKEITPIPMEIKCLIIDTIIATFGFGDDVRTEFSKEDESEHYETLVKLCYDNKEFDAEKIELSRSKNFSEYNFEDYIINFTISSIHISFVKYACDIISFMIQKNLWSLAHAQNFIEITNCDNRLIKAIIKHDIGATTKITDSFLGTLLARDFQKDHLIEKLRDLKKEGVKTIVIAYSMGEVLSAIQHYINWKRMGGFYGLTMQVIAESSHIASIMDFLHNYVALEAPELCILNRQLTKYEVMDMHDYKRITESIIDLWVEKMEENEKQIALITKNMSQSQQTPMSIDL